MQTRKLVVAALAAWLSLASAAWAAPTRDSVTGASGNSFYPFNNFQVDAHSGPSGRAPFGTFSASASATSGSYQFNGVVNCLTVRGNVAAVAGRGTLAQSANGVQLPSRTSTFRLVVEDNGPLPPQPPPDPDEPWLTNDRALVEPFDASTPGCDIPADLSGLNRYYIWLGDVEVHDAPSPPTSKDQCKNGGWRDAGFSSHLECVRGAEQQARQECLFIRAAHGTSAFRAWYGSGVHKRHAMRRCVRERSSN